MPEPGRFRLDLDGYDALAFAGGMLITLGLLQFHVGLALCWLGLCILIYSLLGAKKWASRANKKKSSSSSTESD